MSDNEVCCREFERLVASDAVPLVYSQRFRECSLKLIRIPPGAQVTWRDSSSVLQGILFCPACGTELPSSLRSRYLAEMEKLGIEDALLGPVAGARSVSLGSLVAGGGFMTADSELHACTTSSFWDFVDDPAVPFYYLPANREWGIAHIAAETVSDDWWKTPAIHPSRYCPWCGVEFPPSLPAERHKRLAELNIDPLGDDVPELYATDRWWREDNLYGVD